MTEKRKTNSMRLLEARKISYTAHSYSPDIHSADGVAEVLGVSAAEVFKTLVALPQRGRPLLAIVPGDRELDLKALAKAAGDKKVHMATQKEAEALTGLQVGGISALALLDRGFRVILDASARQFPAIYVSAGERGLNLRVAVEDLVRITRARVAAIATEEPTP
ncbi:MAG: Cys-tRNA(Pro) deacylase [Chloroflexi bacterium]|nr:Cys-tRNA(Pro) deacylase [Chloroflexota bacterium]